MSRSNFRQPHFLAILLALHLPCAAEDSLRVNQEHLGFEFNVSTKRLKKLPGGNWAAGPRFQASNSRGDTLVGPFVLDQVDSSSGEKIWSSRSLPVILGAPPYFIGKGQIRRGMPIRFQPDGRGLVRGPIRLEGFSPRSRWKDVVVGSELKPLEAVAMDSVVLVDTVWRLRVVGDSSTRISNGVVVFSSGARCELDTMLREGDSSGLRWVPGQNPSRTAVQGKDGWKAKARWGSLEFELLIRDRRPPDPVAATILSITQFLGSDTLRYAPQNDDLRWYWRAGGAIACRWDSSYANPNGWRYRGEEFRWHYASFHSPLTWRWSTLVAIQAGQEFEISKRLPEGAPAPWDVLGKEVNLETPDTGWTAPPLDPVESFQGYWWRVVKDWGIQGRIPGVGPVRFGRVFRWKGRDSLVIRGTLAVESDWRGVLGDSTLVEVVIAAKFPSRGGWVEPANHPIRHFRIASENPPALANGTMLQAGSGFLWWEPTEHEGAMRLKAVASDGRILVANDVLAKRVESVFAAPEIQIVPAKGGSEYPTVRTEGGIVVLLEDGLPGQSFVSAPTFPCSRAWVEPSWGWFQEGTRDDLAVKWNFYQPRPFEYRDVGGDFGDCVEPLYVDPKCCVHSGEEYDGVYRREGARVPEVGYDGFRSAFLEGYMRRLPVAFSVEDVRIAVEQVLNPLPSHFRMEVDSLLSGDRLVEEFDNPSLPSSMRAFWNATGLKSRISWPRSDTMLSGLKPDRLVHPSAPGIPWIRVSGDTVAWSLLVRRVDSLGLAGNQIAKELLPVLQELAQTAGGNASRAFWDGFVHGRKGGKGWLWKLHPSWVSNSIMAVRLDHKAPTGTPMGTLVAGFVGILRDPADSALRPGKLWYTYPYGSRWENPFVRRCCGQDPEF